MLAGRADVSLVGPDDLEELVGKGGRLVWRADVIRDQYDRDLLGEVVLIHWVPPEVLSCGPGDCQFVQLLGKVCEALALLLVDDAVSGSLFGEQAVQRGLDAVEGGGVTTVPFGILGLDLFQEVGEGESLLLPVALVVSEDLVGRTWLGRRVRACRGERLRDGSIPCA